MGRLRSFAKTRAFSLVWAATTLAYLAGSYAYIAVEEFGSGFHRGLFVWVALWCLPIGAIYSLFLAVRRWAQGQVPAGFSWFWVCFLPWTSIVLIYG